MAVLRCLFLSALLFTDLTDDVYAIIVPGQDLTCTPVVIDAVSLLSINYRRECLEEIELPHHLWIEFALSTLDRTPAQGIAGTAIPEGLCPGARSHYDEMSLQC